MSYTPLVPFQAWHTAITRELLSLSLFPIYFHFRVVNPGNCKLSVVEEGAAGGEDFQSLQALLGGLH